MLHVQKGSCKIAYHVEKSTFSQLLFCSVTGTIIRPSRSSHDTEKSLFPDRTVDLLKNRLKFFDLIFNGGELNEEEKARGKFIILCETFLQMYKARWTAFEFWRTFWQMFLIRALFVSLILSIYSFWHISLKRHSKHGFIIISKSA